ncbi:hypothetical protein BDZ91DRAFT_107178 [Kalaharituber pfeilii]|nr:hypothetical protein BDZ91DRAFT_107178 [Kalaharituber pfeilii]
MSDLLSLLPDFSLNPQTSNIISSLETQNITVSDLLTLEQLDISKRTSISLLDLRRFTKEVVQALHSSLKSRPVINERAHATNIEGKDDSTTLGVTGLEAWKDQKLISTTDAILDQLLSGGIMTGVVLERLNYCYNCAVVFSCRRHLEAYQRLLFTFLPRPLFRQLD